MTYVRTEKVEGKHKYIHGLKCKQCNSQYERVSGNKYPLNQGWCSQQCRKEWLKQTRRTSTCKQCSLEFYQVNESKLFCDRDCYHQHMKDNPEQYNLHTKAANARSKSNTVETIAKMLATKLANGTIIDWKDATWKQYWKRCNDLTRKMRATMVEDWDGLDYISGEYIKPNLNLPYSHRDYPTLDHIVPRSECYKQGLTPYEACSKSNLRWTTRKNNSKKYNKIQ